MTPNDMTNLKIATLSNRLKSLRTVKSVDSSTKDILPFRRKIVSEQKYQNDEELTGGGWKGHGRGGGG